MSRAKAFPASLEAMASAASSAAGEASASAAAAASSGGADRAVDAGCVVQACLGISEDEVHLGGVNDIV